MLSIVIEINVVLSFKSDFHMFLHFFTLLFISLLQGIFRDSQLIAYYFFIYKESGVFLFLEEFVDYFNHVNDELPPS